MKGVPVENIYFLLCYAWDRLEERNIVNVETEGVTRFADLFARVLLNGVAHVLKRGLDRSYHVREERIPGVRGKLLLSGTLKQNLVPQARTLCAFDELSHDVLHNRIVKATLRSLLRVDELDAGLRERLGGVHRRLNDISEIRLSASAFRAVQLHENIRFYDFLLKVCRVIYENLMINEASGRAKFRDFTRDDRAMPALFQRFLFNFFRRETRYRVSSPRIEWYDVVASADDLAYLPTMQTDIVLRSPGRIIVLDAKYYREALHTYRGKRSVQSRHLYQILSYVNNMRATEGRAVEGLLLYPTVDTSFDLNYSLNGSKVSLRSVDLARPWQEVSSELLRVVQS